MTISDDLMWRYWELLTDKRISEIDAMKESGRNPRDIKLDLAETITASFHPASDAKAAREQWLHDVSQGQIPEDLPAETVSDPRLNRILLATGLAVSTSEADRLIKSGAVSLAPAGAQDVQELAVRKSPTEKIAPGEWIVRTGKRWKRISI